MKNEFKKIGVWAIVYFSGIFTGVVQIFLPVDGMMGILLRYIITFLLLFFSMHLFRTFVNKY